VSKVCPDENCEAVSDVATPVVMANGSISDGSQVVDWKSYLEVEEAVAVELVCFPLKSLGDLVETHMSSCRMAAAAVVVGTLEVAVVAGGTHNVPILTAALITGSGVQPCEVADVHPRMARFGSCCCYYCKKRRLQSYILAVEGMETLGSRSDRGYLGGTLKVSVLEKAS
jgi:hypothetical protein